MKTLISGALCVLPEGTGIRDVGVEEGKIAFVSAHAPADFRPDRRIDGRDRLLCPGFVNAHGHLPMTLFRGAADDCDLQHWLFDEIFPREDRLTEERVAVGTRLAIAESLAGGATSLSDMYFFSDAIAREAFDAGIKLNITRSLAGYQDGQDRRTLPSFREEEELLRNWHMADGGRIRVDAAPHAEYTTTPELWRDVADFAVEHGLIVQTHISETAREHEECVAKYGKTPTELFFEAGLMRTRLCAAHCVKITDEDIAILQGAGAAVAHCPCSNAKLASGIAPVRRMLDAGLCVALGTDGAASNNALSMLGEMKTAAILGKLADGRADALPAETCLRMATEGGAYAQGREAECGRIAPGMDADLVLIDLTNPAMLPRQNAISSLVYAADNTCVEMTMVRGRILFENGRFPTIDVEKLRYEATRAAKELR